MLDTVVKPELPAYQHPSNLSPRERDVLKLLAAGHTNAEIAAVLYVSVNTVKSHVRGILNKLGVEHRLQAAIIALRYEQF
jgi:DNA-binding NarL/FixJ family response regulator